MNIDGGSLIDPLENTVSQEEPELKTQELIEKYKENWLNPIELQRITMEMENEKEQITTTTKDALKENIFQLLRERFSSKTWKFESEAFGMAIKSVDFDEEWKFIDHDSLSNVWLVNLMNTFNITQEEIINELNKNRNIDWNVTIPIEQEDNDTFDKNYVEIWDGTPNETYNNPLDYLKDLSLDNKDKEVVDWENIIPFKSKEAKLKSQQEAEAKAKVEAEAELKSQQEAEAKAKAEAEAKLKSQQEAEAKVNKLQSVIDGFENSTYNGVTFDVRDDWRCYFKYDGGNIERYFTIGLEWNDKYLTTEWLQKLADTKIKELNIKKEEVKEEKKVEKTDNEKTDNEKTDNEESFIDSTTDKIMDIYDKTIEFVDGEKIGFFTGENGEEVEIQYDLKSKTLSIDTAFFDWVTDYDINRCFADVDMASTESARDTIGKHLTELEAEYNAKVKAYQESWSRFWEVWEAMEKWWDATTEFVWETYEKASKAIKEFLWEHPDLGTITLDDGTELNIEFNETDNTFYIDTEFFDGVNDYDSKKVELSEEEIKDILDLLNWEDSEETEKQLSAIVEWKSKELKAEYQEKIESNETEKRHKRIKEVFAGNKKFTNVGEVTIWEETMDVRLVRSGKNDIKIKLNTPFWDGVSDSDVTLLFTTVGEKFDNMWDIMKAVQLKSDMLVDTYTDLIKKEPNINNGIENNAPNIENSEIEWLDINLFDKDYILTPEQHKNLTKTEKILIDKVIERKWTELLSSTEKIQLQNLLENLNK